MAVAELSLRKRMEEIEYFDRQITALGKSPAKSEAAELLRCYLKSEKCGMVRAALAVLRMAIQFERDELIGAMLDGMIE